MRCAGRLGSSSIQNAFDAFCWLLADAVASANNLFCIEKHWHCRPFLTMLYYQRTQHSIKTLLACLSAPSRLHRVAEIRKMP
jgi:hypothetical protein